MPPPKVTCSFDPCARDARANNTVRMHVQDDRRPQQNADPTACEADVGKIQRDEPRCRSTCRASGGLPGQQATPKAIKAMPATRRHRHGDAGQFCAPNNNRPTSEGTISNDQARAASPTAAKISTFSVAPRRLDSPRFAAISTLNSPLIFSATDPLGDGRHLLVLGFR